MSDVTTRIPGNVGTFLENTEYRRRYERADHIVLNRFQRALIAAVDKHRFILGRSGGQVGKSTGAMYIVEGAVTGERPLLNRREPTLDRPYKFVCWILSESGQTTILGPQTRLLGSLSDPGTGMLREADHKKIHPAPGVPGLAGDVECEMDDGSTAIIRFKQYLQGKAALTSEAVDLIICDELPADMALVGRVDATCVATQGTIILVCTPGRQQNAILHWFREGGKSKIIVTGSVDDAEHMSDDKSTISLSTTARSSEAEYLSRYEGQEFAAGGRALSFNPAEVLHDLTLKISARSRAGF